MRNLIKLDKTIHEKARLAIVVTLATHKERAFQDLKGELGMSDGNLLTHLRMLHDAGYVESRKIQQDKKQERTQTWYSLTTKGQSAFQSYLAILEKIIKLKKIDVPKKMALSNRGGK